MRRIHVLKCGPSFESIQCEVRFDKHVLCHVIGIGGILGVPTIGQNLRFMPVHKVLEGPHIALRRVNDFPDELPIRHKLVRVGVWHAAHVRRAYLTLDTAHLVLVTLPPV